MPTPRPDLYATPCSYLAAHQRIYTARGPARNWHCVACGAVAEQWAYRGGSSREQTGDVASRRASGKPRTVRMSWSPDPADYDPFCRNCHGLATRPDYNAGYRKLPAAERAALEREWRRESHRRQVSTPEGRAAYNERKRREKAARTATPTPAATARHNTQETPA